MIGSDSSSSDSDAVGPGRHSRGDRTACVTEANNVAANPILALIERRKLGLLTHKDMVDQLQRYS
eukprot:SAG31_NODE_15360_length_759_cov_0.739394_1_plen_64_part_10